MDPPHFATGAYWGRLPPAPNSPFLVLRTKPTPKSDPETPPWNEIRHFRPHEAGGGIWRGERKKKREKNSKSICEVFVTLTKKKKSRRRQKKAFFASRWEFCGITTGPPHRGTLMKDLVDLFQEFLGVTDPGLLQWHRTEMPLEFGTWIP